MAFTLCTSGAAAVKAGANCSPTILASKTIMDAFSDESEGKICAELHTDVVTNYTSYDTLMKQAFSDVASSLIALKMIAYDLSGYTNQREGETLLDLNDDISNKGLQVLKNKTKLRFST